MIYIQDCGSNVKRLKRTTMCHLVVGGTGRFAHDLSEESWPWWIGPAGPAKLKQSKQRKTN